MIIIYRIQKGENKQLNKKPDTLWMNKDFSIHFFNPLNH